MRKYAQLTYDPREPDDVYSRSSVQKAIEAAAAREGLTIERLEDYYEPKMGSMVLIGWTKETP